MIKGHGGNIYELAQHLGCTPREIFDMSSNVNPLGPPEGLISYMVENIDAVNALPEVDANRAVEAFARRYDIDPDLVLAGNGTTQFIYTIPTALESRRVLILGPTYSDYGDACFMHGVSHSYLMAEENSEFTPDIEYVEKYAADFDTVFICNPNNPTGTLIPGSRIEYLCKALPQTRFVVDESYLPFVSGAQSESVLNAGLSNVIVLNSMSKIFRIPGLRIGFMVSSKEIVERFLRYALPWSANSIAQLAVVYLMQNREEIDAFIQSTRRFLEAEKRRFLAAFHGSASIRPFPSRTSFVLARLLGQFTAEQVCAFLAGHRILIRNCSNFKGLNNRFIRVSFKTRDVNTMLEEKLLTMLNR